MAEQTFRSYSAEQATQYAIQRGTSYPTELYQEILAYHRSNHGKWQRLLDVGCGPGKSTHDLAPFFDKAIGIDHSQQMIEVAKSRGYQTKSGPVHFAVSDAEHFDKLDDMYEGSVDLITSGTAAHWFDMNKFWHIAGHVLAPGGTVALWTYSSLYCHPDTPNADAVQKVLSDFKNNVLGEYALPGNIISQQMYENLPLPWDISPPGRAFDRSLFSRIEWNRDGKLESGQSEFLSGFAIGLQQIAESKPTASAYTRWAEANPDLAGGDNDCVKVEARKLHSVTGLKYGDKLKLGRGVVLLMFSKQAKQ